MSMETFATFVTITLCIMTFAWGIKFLINQFKEEEEPIFDTDDDQLSEIEIEFVNKLGK